MEDYHYRNEVKLFKIFLAVAIFLISFPLARLGIDLSIDTIDGFFSVSSGDIIGGLFAFVVAFIVKLSLYLVFLLLIPFFLWKGASFFIDKYDFYPYLLNKTDHLPYIHSLAIWIGLSLSLLLPILFKDFSMKTVKPAPYDNTSLKIAGHIDKDIKYKIKTNYLATYDSRRCKQRTLLSGSPNPKKKSFDYQPIIANEQHQVSIPLYGTTGENFCEYQIKNVQICFTIQESKRSGCWDLFVTENSSSYMSDGRRYKKAKNNKLTIKCLKNGYCTQDLSQRESITQYLDKENLSYTVDIDLISNQIYKKHQFLQDRMFKKRKRYLELDMDIFEIHHKNYTPKIALKDLEKAHKKLIKLSKKAFVDSSKIVEKLHNLQSYEQKVLYHEGEKLYKITEKIEGLEEIYAKHPYYQKMIASIITKHIDGEFISTTEHKIKKLHDKIYYKLHSRKILDKFLKAEMIEVYKEILDLERYLLITTKF